MTCTYITSLDRECGRDATHGPHCRFHSVLHEFETNCGDGVNVAALREAVKQ